MSLYSESDLSVIPYPNAIDFEKTLPNKFFEYLSANLLVAHCGLTSISSEPFR